MSADAESVLDFWLGNAPAQAWPDAGRTAMWWGGNPALDGMVRDMWGSWVAQALDGGLSEWEAAPRSRLALILLLDQFTRNVHRGTGLAFAGDTRATALARAGMAAKLERKLPWAAQAFFYMPLMHQEDLGLQDEAAQAFKALQRRAPKDLKPTLKGFVDSAAQHRDIVAQFGRFPHRNAALGRKSTAAEKTWLKTGKRFGQ